MPHSAIDIALVPRTVKAVSLSSPVLCGEYEQRPCGRNQWDSHYALEFGIVLSGRMLRVYRESETLLGPGQVWMCGMWEPHAFRVPAGGCQVIVCTIWPPFLAGLRFAEAPGVNWLAPFTVAPRHRPQASAGQRRWFVALARRFSRCCAEPDPMRKEWFHLLLLEGLLELMRDWQPSGPLRTPPEGGLERINQAVQTVFSRRGRVTVAEASRACGMGRNRFSRFFQDVTGISFPNFGLRYRLSAAAGQLVESDEPIKAIARNWGFTDGSHLHRLFVRHYGIAPLLYRQRAQEVGESARPARKALASP